MRPRSKQFLTFTLISGLVGDVQMNRSDIGWADLYLFPERKAVADFTFPHLSDSVCFMASKPVNLPNLWSLIIPLQPMTWLGFLLTVLFTMVIVKNFPKSLADNSKEADNDKENWVNVGFVIHIILDYSSSYLKTIR